MGGDTTVELLPPEKDWVLEVRDAGGILGAGIVSPMDKTSE